MTLMTRKPLPTAFELNRNDIALTVIVGASRLGIDVHTIDGCVADLHTRYGIFSRGQTKTSTDAITKQAIMTMNPPLKEPVR